ncbi:transmembrane protein 94-like [Paramacrobiotus metropolitanus]|uniref:transmembrane protein 94-like n=1 Tax=Paramacrobiotus metropolitanus TaxID=2943436 RepID=UPI002445F341|nr:transmembrane protein 94-like [Paramacrobiotus metropolitanus]
MAVLAVPGEETIGLLPKRLSDTAALRASDDEPGPAKINQSGLSTRHALTLFARLIEDEQSRYRRSVSWRNWVQDAFDQRSSRSIFRWPELLLIVLQCVLTVAGFLVQDAGGRVLIKPVECAAVLAVLVLFGVVNVLLSCLEARGRHLELWCQVISILATIRQELQGSKKLTEWKHSYYPDVLCPDSPCVALQWTYRDNAVINLPAILLVPGDIIVVRPGQRVVCHCNSVKETPTDATEITLMRGEIYQPDTDGEMEAPLSAVQRTAAAEHRFIVQEAPFRSILVESLSNKPLNRPSSIIEKQRITTLNYIMGRFLPGVAVLYLIGNIIEICVFVESTKRRWAEEFLFGWLYVLLPLTSLVFPSLWLGMNYIILARVLSVFQKFKRKKLKHDHLHEAKLTDAMYIVKADWASIWQRFRSLVKGTNDSLFQTSNIVHTLGNVTAICCTDKKGVLSWPNPNAEKIFTLHARGDSVSASKVSLRHSSNSLQEMGHSADEALTAKSFERHNSLSVVHQEVPELIDGVAEVVDITQSGGREFEIDFDDPSWTRMLGNLKPLGLAVLLNTCSKEVQDYYRAFTDHVSCVALHHDQSVPVVNRRCLCSFSKLMGFTSTAESIFRQVQRMAFYRKPNKTPRELEGRYKTPFPNMLSVIVQDTKSGGLQVLSQGTADLVLDTCTDYWNGQETRPLTPEDRRHILEFYTRFSMTAYCTAFSYSPLTTAVAEQSSDSDSDEDEIFIELPSEEEDVSMHELTSQISRTSSGLVREMYESCCKNQVFLGCVAQQYQSRNDFVHLIDLLEQACIRFIHFSTETELRSRVFAERLGLESGWNCHIALDSQGIDPNSLDPDVVQPAPVDNNAKKDVSVIVVEQELDLENRARLPRGIENIREHIASVDNVPLLVSLFTDCRPESIQEMIAIMQENGEVVCCLGSSGNLTNSAIFLQADAAIAIEPMYPKICATSSTPRILVDRKHLPCTPMELMKTLTSLNCSLSCQKEDPMSIMQLVIESRHNLAVLRNCFKYLISAGIFVVIMNTLANFLCFPPPISVGHIILLVCFSLPLLSLSLLSVPHDRNLMRISTGKNRVDDIVNRESVCRFLWTFLARWLPSVFVVLACHALLLLENCHAGAGTCYPALANLTTGETAVSLNQNLCALLVILYFDVISMGYGNNKPGFWKYSPLKNLLWILAALTGIFAQLIYFFLDVDFVLGRHSPGFNGTSVWRSREEFDGEAWYDSVPYYVWLLGFLWPLLLFPVNELIKKFELAALDKQQKRARLQFGTKLGMNSPF